MIDIITVNSIGWTEARLSEYQSWSTWLELAWWVTDLSPDCDWMWWTKKKTPTFKSLHSPLRLWVSLIRWSCRLPINRVSIQIVIHIKANQGSFRQLYQGENVHVTSLARLITYWLRKHRALLKFFRALRSQLTRLRSSTALSFTRFQLTNLCCGAQLRSGDQRKVLRPLWTWRKVGSLESWWLWQRLGEPSWLSQSPWKKLSAFSKIKEAVLEIAFVVLSSRPALDACRFSTCCFSGVVGFLFVNLDPVAAFHRGQVSTRDCDRADWRGMAMGDDIKGESCLCFALAIEDELVSLLCLFLACSKTNSCGDSCCCRRPGKTVYDLSSSLFSRLSF